MASGRFSLSCNESTSELTSQLIGRPSNPIGNYKTNRSITLHRRKPTIKPAHILFFVTAALTLATLSVGISLLAPSMQAQKTSSATYPSKRMADAKQWMTQNLDVATPSSYCYADGDANCRHYGRLYTWEAARQACQSLGGGWRLPSDDEWRQLAKHYGGVSADSEDQGKAAYKALLTGGTSGFNAVLGGGRSVDGQYARLEAHGFYWTASEIDAANGWFYNFGKGGQALHRQTGGGENKEAFAVRCVRE